jgi:hypothetical protein
LKQEFNAEEKKKWDTTLDLDKGGRDDLKGHDIHYYLDIYNEIKLEQNHSLLKRDDAWFAEGKTIWLSKSVLLVPMLDTNQSVTGAKFWLKKRIPPQLELKLPERLRTSYCWSSFYILKLVIPEQGEDSKVYLVRRTTSFCGDR